MGGMSGRFPQSTVMGVALAVRYSGGAVATLEVLSLPLEVPSLPLEVPSLRSSAPRVRIVNLRCA